jgi:hypothetical protein
MPVRISKDSDGCYARWGQEGKKYYYECGNANERAIAKDKAQKQGIAIGDFDSELIKRIQRIAKNM